VPLFRPLLVALIGLGGSFAMMRLPDPTPPSPAQGAPLG
jgi:hypothetical protein